MNAFMTVVANDVNVYFLVAIVIAVFTLGVLFLVTPSKDDGGRTKLTKTTQWDKKSLQVKVWGVSPKRNNLKGNVTIKTIANK